MAKRKGRKLPRVLTEDERRELLKKPNPRYPTELRNLAITQLVLDAGLKVSEVTVLKWNDVDLLSGKLLVRQGKGAKDRTLWLGGVDLDLLRKWRERQIEKVGRPVEHVFTTLKGEHLQNRYVQAMIERYAGKAVIKASPHTLRHTFATDLYRETKNIRLVQKALGHSDLSTTMIYTHIVDEELEEAMRFFVRKR